MSSCTLARPIASSKYSSMKLLNALNSWMTILSITASPWGRSMLPISIKVRLPSSVLYSLYLFSLWIDSLTDKTLGHVNYQEPVCHFGLRFIPGKTQSGRELHDHWHVAWWGRCPLLQNYSSAVSLCKYTLKPPAKHCAPQWRRWWTILFFQNICRICKRSWVLMPPKKISERNGHK